MRFLCLLYSKKCCILYCTFIFYYFSEPRTEIVGKKELYVDYASSLNITCLIKSPNPPAYVFWKKTMFSRKTLILRKRAEETLGMEISSVSVAN